MLIYKPAVGDGRLTKHFFLEHEKEDTRVTFAKGDQTIVWDAGFPRWREAGENWNISQFSQLTKCKEAGANKYRAGTGITGYGKRKVYTPLSPPPPAIQGQCRTSRTSIESYQLIFFSGRNLARRKVSRTRAKEAYTAGGYPGCCRMKQLRVFLPSPPPPGWDASPSQG